MNIVETGTKKYGGRKSSLAHILIQCFLHLVVHVRIKLATFFPLLACDSDA